MADEVQVRVTAEERARLASTGPVSAAATSSSCWVNTIVAVDRGRPGAGDRSISSSRCGWIPAMPPRMPASRTRGGGADLGRRRVRTGAGDRHAGCRKGAGARPRSRRSACVARPHQVRARMGLERRRRGVHTGPRDRSKQRRTRTSFRPCCAWRSVLSRGHRSHAAGRGARSAVGDGSVVFGRVLYRARRYDEAIAHLNRAIELEPQSPARAYVGWPMCTRPWAGTRGAGLLEKEPHGGRAGPTIENCACGPDIRADGQAAGSAGNPRRVAWRQSAHAGNGVHGGGDTDKAFRLLFGSSRIPISTCM